MKKLLFVIVFVLSLFIISSCHDDYRDRDRGERQVERYDERQGERREERQGERREERNDEPHTEVRIVVP